MSQPQNPGRSCPVCFKSGPQCQCGVTCAMCGNLVGPFVPAAHGTIDVCEDNRACEVRCVGVHQNDAAEAYARAREHHKSYRIWASLHALYLAGGENWPGPKHMLGWDDLLERMLESAVNAQDEAQELYDYVREIRDRPR